MAGETCEEADSFTYIHGHQNILAGIERALEGKRPGDDIRVQLQPSEAFGEYIEQEPIRVHRSEFGPDFVNVREGQQIGVRNSAGENISLFVVKKEGSYVTLGFNHPLAGESFVFIASVLETRKARDNEKAQGPPFAEDEPGPSCGCC